jgi:hypothetical protein
MARNERHVVKNPESGWDIKKPHAERASSHAGTKAEAILRARKICKNEGAECIIHGENGRFRNYNSYGKYPFSSRDGEEGSYRGMITRLHKFFSFIWSNLPTISGKH